jgi:hypothetical protein
MQTIPGRDTDAYQEHILSISADILSFIHGKNPYTDEYQAAIWIMDMVTHIGTTFIAEVSTPATRVRNMHAITTGMMNHVLNDSCAEE